MKRRIFIILILLGLACIDATAQLYLFPSRRKSRPDTVFVSSARMEADTVLSVVADSLEQEFVPDIPETVKVCLAMPFSLEARSQGSNFLDFYSGALLAARDLGNSGIKIELDVFDCFNEDFSRFAGKLQEGDVIIGPVSPADILSELDVCPEDKWVISPLDQRAASLASTHNVIHAASSSEAQAEELVKWIAEDQESEYGKVTLLKEKGIEGGEMFRYLTEKLGEYGIACDTVSYGLLEGLTAADRFFNVTDTLTHRRYVIASDNEAFVGDVIRNLAMMKYKGAKLTAYGTSRIKSFESLEQEDLYSISLKLTASYDIDYGNQAVKDFILTYRALFQAEPNAYSFSGYDIMHYFVNICAKYGRAWSAKLQEFEEYGLQENFRFTELEPANVNKAVRRISYNPDHSITVQ